MNDVEAQAVEVLPVGQVEALPVGQLAASRLVALREAWAAFWASRAIVWIAGMAAVVLYGWAPDTAARLDPLYFTQPFGDTFGNLLAAPAARFDSAWFLAIAQHGYDILDRTAFFPLYPALVAGVGKLFGSFLIAGILISWTLGIVALYLVHRLVSLDFDAIDARNTVWLMAFFPSAVVLSAVYSESLYLVLSLGAIYMARLGRWPIAGLLGAPAAATRSSGVLLTLVLLVLYLYGPRADRARQGFAGWRPRHRLRPDVLWIGLVPLGLIAYMAYLAAATGHPLAAFGAQAEWARVFLPLGGLALGAWNALLGVINLVPWIHAPGTTTAPGDIAGLIAARDITLFAFLVLGLWLLSRSWRRLPAAYNVHVIVGLLLPLSFPAARQPLISIPRFMFVLFPLWISLALWARERDRMRVVLGVMAVLMGIFSAMFTTWTWAP